MASVDGANHVSMEEPTEGGGELGEDAGGWIYGVPGSRPIFGKAFRVTESEANGGAAKTRETEPLEDPSLKRHKGQTPSAEAREAEDRAKSLAAKALAGESPKRG